MKKAFLLSLALHGAVVAAVCASRGARDEEGVVEIDLASMEIESRPEIAPPPEPPRLSPEKPKEVESKRKEASDPASIIAPPRPERAITPEYPRSARRKGREGRVIVEATIDESGKVVAAKVDESSNWAELDAAALKAVKEAAFTPAKAEAGAIKSTVRLPLVFRLR